MRKPGRLLVRKILQLSGIGIFILALLVFSFLNKGFTTDDDTSQTSYIGSPSIPEEMDFCGEEVPLRYYDIRESLERELMVNMYFHSQTLLLIKKSQRYLPTIEPILKKYKIPDDFKYLMIAEGNLSNSVSPAGATGFWQLLKGTAEDYGLEVNAEVDERYHLEKATEAACQYLLDSYSQYENWTLVAASYNVGRRGVDRQIERQNEKNYYDLLFNEETARYVFRILALKAVLQDPEKYYFDVPRDERYRPVPFKLITVDSGIEDIAAFAREHDTNYKLLKYLNPWLRDNQLTNTGRKSYLIKIPTRREITQ